MLQLKIIKDRSDVVKLYFFASASQSRVCCWYSWHFGPTGPISKFKFTTLTPLFQIGSCNIEKYANIEEDSCFEASIFDRGQCRPHRKGKFGGRNLASVWPLAMIRVKKNLPSAETVKLFHVISVLAVCSFCYFPVPFVLADLPFFLFCLAFLSDPGVHCTWSLIRHDIFH